jgi:hypothetical protein
MTKKNKYTLADDFVTTYPRKHEQGFVHTEITAILKTCKRVEGFSEEKFYDALMCNTGLLIEGEFITYPHDIELAVACGLENRDLTISEWD